MPVGDLLSGHRSSRTFRTAQVIRVFWSVSATKLARHDDPDSLAAIARLPCLVFGSPTETRWHCGQPDDPPLDVSAVFVTDDMETLREVALTGVGFALLPEFMAGEEIERGRLRIVRVNEELVPDEIFAVYPGHRIASQSARKLVRFLQQRIAQLPHWIDEPVQDQE